MQTIESYTDDYQFGFGAFVEKPAPPMAKTESSYTHSFEHIVDMTKDTTDLSSKIRQTNLKANWDTPEAGFDGLMQVRIDPLVLDPPSKTIFFIKVIKCGDKIGWRPDVTKIIVLITDAPQHISGDGIVGGMWRPYVHTCRLEQSQSAWVKEVGSNGRTVAPQAMVYKSSLEYDYPSLSDINYALDQEQMTLIFGTPLKVLPLYQQMAGESGVIYR